MRAVRGDLHGPAADASMMKRGSSLVVTETSCLMLAPIAALRFGNGFAQAPEHLALRFARGDRGIGDLALFHRCGQFGFDGFAHALQSWRPMPISSSTYQS